MLTNILFLIGIFKLLQGTTNPNDQSYKLSIYIESGNYKIEEGVLDSQADVRAIFADNTEQTGWGTLEVRIDVQSNPTTTDEQRAYAAGIAEGYLTSKRIYQTYTNTLSTQYWNFTNGPDDSLKNFLVTQQAWMDQQINNNLNDPFWQYANLLNNQLNGLWYGYNLTATNNGVPEFSDMWPLQFLNLVGDLLDLESALYPDQRLDYHNYTNNKDEYIRKLLLRGRCSALIKLTPLLDDLFIGHSSWFIFQNMNRIFKHYIFNFNTVKTSSKHMMFSSYPGYLESLDDFYIMDNGIAMLQTTNGIPNTTLYDYVIPQSLFAWQRVRIANALASSGEEWYNLVSTANSGTYNNQYMVINYGIFKPNYPIPDNFLWVIEQIPGYVAGQDMSNIVKRGYFASYNVPAIEIIYNMSGYPDLVQQLGVSNSYDLAPRARIFRRDANKVQTFDQYKKILRYNNYKKDPIEEMNPMWAICSRGDLTLVDPSPSGCYDSKAANLSMILNMQATAINGPTADDLPPFSWSNWPSYLHNGIAETMDFSWVWMESVLA